MYSKEEFKATCLKRGYASAGTIAIFLKNNPKDEYTEDDLIECYRFNNREPLRREPIKLECIDDEERLQRLRDTWI